MLKQQIKCTIQEFIDNRKLKWTKVEVNYLATMIMQDILEHIPTQKNNK